MQHLQDVGLVGQALPPAWRRYREAFAVLQHMCTIGGAEAGAGVPWARVPSELGLTDRDGEELLTYLLAAGCIEYHQGERHVALTEAGLEHLAGERRRSVRPGSGSQAGRRPISQRRAASSASWAVNPFTRSRSADPRS